MARREGEKQQILNQLTDTLCETILSMEIGSKTSIERLVNRHYERLGYESRHLGINLGWCWTKDGGKTYVVAGDDLFTVLDLATEKLEGKRTLDLSEYENLLVGLPYNLNFTIREACENLNFKITLTADVEDS